MKLQQIALLVGVFCIGFEPITGQSSENGNSSLCPGDNCTAASVTGPCRAYFRLWFYNTATRRCEIFVYGGCSGNGNRYCTRKACERRCLRRTKPNTISNDQMENDGRPQRGQGKKKCGKRACQRNSYKG